MNSYSSNQAVERAQPWLGTLVSIRVHGLAERAAHGAIDAAFEEIATVHRLMSFHDADSDVSRLNRDGVRRPMTVHSYTFKVLQEAIRFSACSNGCFDISVGAELVNWKLLPPPAGAEHAPQGSWRDVELLAENQVIYHRPLWIDLGGIAKGFAVDRATECLRAHGALQTVVNAGGDLRVQGENAEPIRLSAESSVDSMPVLELTEGSAAGSCGDRQRRWHDGRWWGPHVDGARRSPASTSRFVCVVAERCLVADALTKVVMARGEESAELLRQFGASAYVHDPGRGWRHLDVERVEIG
jgi:thiamine biosynthesis lipoprotein